MRGKRLLDGLDVGAHRIIPAHAGQTTGSAPAITRDADHPRACGANLSLQLAEDIPDGSSPRMRGKRRVWFAMVGRCRIIPAHAGQTIFSGRFLIPSADHPRACGAN